MDEINDFFDFSKEFKRVIVPEGAVSGNTFACAGSTSNSSKPVKRELIGKEYSNSVVDNEIEMLKIDVATTSDKKPLYRFDASSSLMGDLEDFSDGNDDDEIRSHHPEAKIKKVDDYVFDKYNFNMNLDTSLPIFHSKELILAKIREHPAVVIEGDTGCGKTTQVPQYILEDAFQRREYCRIVCTQPRRIAAISIAKRVSEERKWQEGTVVGYKVGLHDNMNADTRILYCTTGVLLQSLITLKSLTQYTHIILDEVHERDKDIDFLMILLRRLWRLNSKNVKIILMSATINSKKFSEYFPLGGNPAPILSVDARRQFYIREYYLNELDRINSKNAMPDYNKPGISIEMYDLAVKLIIVMDRIDCEELEAKLGRKVETHDNLSSILIFLPGINEIDQMVKQLERLRIAATKKFLLWPIRLHSMVAADEQARVFHRAPPGHRKVILATNIAESSITVPDVKFVIDFCLTKMLTTDSYSNFSTLQLDWASRANCRQRAGRAGRVSNGRVYRMVSEDFYKMTMREFGIPEMERSPLETMVLKAKLLDIDTPANILALAMSPPNLSDIQNTILTLKEVGALNKNVNGMYTSQDGDLTFLGRVMASLPLDVRLSRLVMFGYIFTVLEESIIIAAGLSVRSIFNSDGRQSSVCDPFIEKLTWSDGSGSDLFAILRAYKVWMFLRQQHNFNGQGEYDWAKRYFINLRSLKEMYLLVEEVKKRVEFFGIKEQIVQRVNWTDREKTIILKIVIAGAFYPNYFTRSNINNEIREREMYVALGGNDPCNTVFFTGFNKRNIGKLYTGAVKDLFRDVHILPQNIDVRFQPGSERIFVIFKNDPDIDGNAGKRMLVPGRVSGDVYRAVRMRREGVKCIIHTMDHRMEMKQAEALGLGTMIDGTWHPKETILPHLELLVLPSIFQAAMTGHIMHIENCSKFYFQPLFEVERLREIERMMNEPEQIRTSVIENAGAITRGMIVAAPFEEKYQRAKILELVSSTRRQLEFKVLFIDYGNMGLVDFKLLRLLSNHCTSLIDIPPRVCECRLAMVQPSTVVAPDGLWRSTANDDLHEVAATGVVELQVYSVEGGIVNVLLNMGDGATLNDLLVDKGEARKSDENYMSKMDHDKRQRKQVVASRFFDSDQERQNDDYIRSTLKEIDLPVKAPPRDLCTGVVTLRGPFSPLECSIFSTVAIGTWKTATVERDSVNSVLIDTDPQDAHERMIVAASITEDEGGTRLQARSTTLMPNIHAFGALMTMIFCPTMQLKTNKNRTRYVTILAGLGYDVRTNQPLYAEHDIVMSLDADFTTADLMQINLLRYCIDSMVICDTGEDLPKLGAADRGKLAAKIKHLTISLLNKNRNYIETHIDSEDNVWEPLIPGHRDVHVQDGIYDQRAVFPPHPIPTLNDENSDHLHALRVHCQELHRLKQFSESTQDLPTCQLCNQPIENIAQLRIHLLSQLHCDREKHIGFEMTLDF